MRQIFLDTETAGLSTMDGHRIIEIACVEMVDGKLTGKTYHQHINPQRDIDPQAVEIHGITNEFLMYKPIFQQIVREFVVFIDKAELLIHNAEFDIEFLDLEFSLIDTGCYPILPMRTWCKITDTLALARKMHPDQKNSLQALMERYRIDMEIYEGEYTGALYDAAASAEIYLIMKREN